MRLMRKKQFENPDAETNYVLWISCRVYRIIDHCPVPDEQSKHVAYLDVVLKSKLLAETFARLESNEVHLWQLKTFLYDLSLSQYFSEII